MSGPVCGPQSVLGQDYATLSSPSLSTPATGNVRPSGTGRAGPPPRGTSPAPPRKPLRQATLRRSLAAPPPRPRLRTPPSRGVRRLRAILRSPMPTSWARMASSRRRSVSAASRTTSVCSVEVPDIMWTPVPRSPPPPKLAPPRPQGPPLYRRSLRRARSQKTR